MKDGIDTSVTNRNRPLRPRQGSPLLYFLVFISCIFLGILIFAYTVTKKTHPIYVDEQGKPVNADSTDHPGSGSSGSK